MPLSSERPDLSILLPDVSVIGGDIYLLPDVAAPFLPHLQMTVLWRCAALPRRRNRFQSNGCARLYLCDFCI